MVEPLRELERRPAHRASHVEGTIVGPGGIQGAQQLGDALWEARCVVRGALVRRESGAREVEPQVHAQEIVRLVRIVLRCFDLARMVLVGFVCLLGRGIFVGRVRPMARPAVLHL